GAGAIRGARLCAAEALQTLPFSEAPACSRAGWAAFGRRSCLTAAGGAANESLGAARQATAHDASRRVHDLRGPDRGAVRPRRRAPGVLPELPEAAHEVGRGGTGQRSRRGAARPSTIS